MGLLDYTRECASVSASAPTGGGNTGGTSYYSTYVASQSSEGATIQGSYPVILSNPDNPCCDKPDGYEFPHPTGDCQYKVCHNRKPRTVATNIVFKRRDPHGYLTNDKEYGHWWVEIGDERWTPEFGQPYKV